MPRTLSTTLSIRVGALVLPLIIAAAMLAAISPAESVNAQERSLRVNMAIWIPDASNAELCIDLRDSLDRQTRRCPDANRLNVPRAPEGRWLRSADLQIAPEVAIYARARRSGELVDFGLGVVIEGEARGIRGRTWRLEWGAAAPNRWTLSSTITLRLPVAPFPELWSLSSGIAAGAPRLELGRAAPDFALPALTPDSDADTSSGDSLIPLFGVRADGEQITVIVFWSSWAPRAGETLRTVSDLAARDGDLRALGVNVYEIEEGAGQAFAREHGGGILHLADATGEVARHYRVDGVPELFVLDADGVYRGVVRGAAPLSRILALIAAAR